MFSYKMIALLLGLFLLPPSLAQGQLVDEVDPLIGTAGEGQTYPGAGVPFGMTQWSPETRKGEGKCVAPYYYGDKRVFGIRASHFMSGSCTQEFGSLTLVPLAGPVTAAAIEAGLSLDHREESARPFVYKLSAPEQGVEMELTGTARAGLVRLRFRRGSGNSVLVQNNSRSPLGWIHVDPVKGEIIGENPVLRIYAGNGQPAGISGFFVVQFDQPVIASGLWNGTAVMPGKTDGKTQKESGYVSFRSGEVKARIGISFTSLEEARRNLNAEIPGWDFEAVKEQAKAAWESALSSITITEANPVKRRIFYTALYHTMLGPTIMSDADGSYRSFGGGKEVKRAGGFTYYDNYSLWDTFRAVHPLLTLIDPKRELDMVQSLIVKGQQGGFLPIYPAWNNYTSEMIGDHANAVIVDAYVKGLQGFDVAEAYHLMRHNALDSPTSQSEYADGRGRRALPSYLKYGYIPLEDQVPFAFHHHEQVSRTLEYAYDDFLVAVLAKGLGHADEAKLFSARARNYRNVIDPATGFARGRHEDGSWAEPFDPFKPADYVTEGLPVQYTFFVPHDINGLIALVGGDSVFTAKLDAMFARGAYNQGNEPSHHIAYLYDFAGQPWKTQLHVQEIMAQYKATSDGLPGNDDCGQMSAWYVFSAMGFYPVAPGIPKYSIGSPLFDSAVLHLPGGRSFEVHAPGASEGKHFIRSARLNGRELGRTWLTHSEVTAGGRLELEMSFEAPREQTGGVH